MTLRFKYDAAKDRGNQDNPDETPEPETEEVTRYKSVGSTRNLCFVQADGKRLFLNYAYLISGEYNPDESSISLAYTTHDVTIKGSNLEDLYEELMHQVARVIVATDKRYEDTEDGKNVSITEITAVKHNS